MNKLITTTLLSAFVMAPEVFAGVNKHESHQMSHHHEMMDKHHISIGQIGNRSEVTKTLEVRANDQMKFSLSGMQFKAGETIEFIVTNEGQLPHEFVLGTREQIEMHRQEMANMLEMEHSDSNTLSLKPGEIKTLIWKFTSIGNFLAACTLPGHYEAGMITAIKVSKSN